MFPAKHLVHPETRQHMVDYSKWDKLEVSDDEEDAPRRPTVTKLDSASRVTIPAARDSDGRAEVTVIPESEDAEDQIEDAMTTEDYFASFEEKAPKAAFVGGPVGSAPAAPSKPDWTRNGYRAATHTFCQSVDEVSICVLVPLGSKAKDVAVQLSKSGNLTVKLSGASVFSKQLAHEVHGMDRTALTAQIATSSHDSDGERDDGEDWDWELLDFDDSNRIVRITLKKRPPAGLRAWWRKAFVDDTMEVDVSSIPDRQVVGGVDASTGKKPTMAEVWEQAHEAFRRKMAAHKPTEIDFGEGGSDGDDDDSDMAGAAAAAVSTPK